MLPIVPALITGGKFVLGGIASGIAGNWLSEKLGIGIDEPVVTQKYETVGFFQKYDVAIIAGLLCVLMFLEIQKIRKGR